MRNFGFAEVTHVRKNSNKFGISLFLYYLCSQKIFFLSIRHRSE